MSTLGELQLRPFATEPNPVLENIMRKRDLLAAGDPAPEGIRAVLILGGGGMGGAYGAGTVRGLEEVGLRETFDDVIGISAGAACGAYLLSGQVHMGTRIYYEDLSDARFIKFSRLGNVMDLDYLEHVLRTVKPLDQTAIRASRSRLHIGVTNLETGTYEYLPVVKKTHEKAPDIVKMIRATSSVPGFVKEPRVAINGKYYTDGVIACKNPVAYAIDQLGATDVILVLNQNLEISSQISLQDKLFALYALRKQTQALRAGYFTRLGSDSHAQTEYPETVNIGVICPPEDPISTGCRDSRKVEQAARKSTTLVHQLFGS